MTAAVETRDLTKKFGSFTAVNSVSMKIEEGSVYGFLGPNGSGKSTTIRMLCGLLAPSSGMGLVLGMNLARDGKELKQHVGYMSQKFSLYPDMTVIENLNLYAGLYGLRNAKKRDKIEEMLCFAGLPERKNDLVATLSGGRRQRLALGCSIMHDPAILFLDEPTGGVDPKARRQFWDVIYELASKGTTVMVTTHFMDEAEHCDRVAFIYFGDLIADDSPKDLKKKIPGRLYRVSGGDEMILLSRLAEVTTGEVIDSYFFGAKLHVLISEGASVSGGSLKAILGGCSAERISPSMEDVFVYLVKSRRAAAENGIKV